MWIVIKAQYRTIQTTGGGGGGERPRERRGRWSEKKIYIHVLYSLSSSVTYDQTTSVETVSIMTKGSEYSGDGVERTLPFHIINTG